MILRHHATILKRTESLGSEGEKIYAFSHLKSIKCDIQPTTLSPAQSEAYGASDRSSGARKMFFVKDDSLKQFMRVLHVSSTYEIVNINPWQHHYEATLLPVQP